MIRTGDDAAVILRAMGYRVSAWVAGRTRCVAIQVPWCAVFEAGRVLGSLLPGAATDAMGGECVLHWPGLPFDGPDDDELEEGPVAT